MLPYIREFHIIHSGAPEPGIAEQETAGVDNIHRRAEAGAESNNRGCVLRNIRLEKSNAHQNNMLSGSNILRMQLSRFLSVLCGIVPQTIRKIPLYMVGHDLAAPRIRRGTQSNHVRIQMREPPGSRLLA